LGTNPAPLIRRIISFSAIWFTQPTAATTFSSSMVEPKSLAPKKTELADFFAHGNPRTLNVSNIIKKDPGDSERLEVINRRNFMCNPFAQKIIPRLKNPRDKSPKPSRTILERADMVKMFDPVFRGFYMAKHHRGSGTDPLPVAELHDIKPFCTIQRPMILKNSLFNPLHNGGAAFY
jgi:hypothetical protein